MLDSYTIGNIFSNLLGIAGVRYALFFLGTSGIAYGAWLLLNRLLESRDAERVAFIQAVQSHSDYNKTLVDALVRRMEKRDRSRARFEKGITVTQEKQAQMLLLISQTLTELKNSIEDLRREIAAKK